MAGKAGMWKKHRNQGKLGGNKPQEVEIEKTTPKRSFDQMKVFETR